ncbi:MAG TPA: YbaB/EbfC family nucleoid-associated protein [Dongiaceae bacterium]|nr:YbaB/EbfC family nucleoid-associated protein [Dongiaceae bacterium]
MKNLSQMLKQAQEMQSKMAEMQTALADLEIVGQSGGGFVAVTVNGKGELKRVKIDPKLADPNEIAVLEDLIVAAARDAKDKADAAVQEQMAKLTGGLQLPPGFKLPF